MTLARRVSAIALVICAACLCAVVLDSGRRYLGGVARADVIAQMDAGLAAPLVVVGEGSGPGSAECPLGIVNHGLGSDGLPICGGVAPLPTDPLAEIGLVEKLYRSGALVDVGILVAFFGLTFASSRVPLLQRDHYAVIVSAALGGLALLAVPAAQGQTPNVSMVLTALLTVGSLALNPKLPAAMAAKRA